jgi:hypothetical protein
VWNFALNPGSNDIQVRRPQPNSAKVFLQTNHQADRKADMPLDSFVANSWNHIQAFLFPMLREEVGPMTVQHERLVVVLDMARVERFIQTWPGFPGRPLEDRCALARAFIAKAVLDLPTTSGLIERLSVDPVLRRLCGWECRNQVPSESTFSRAFAEFAQTRLPALVHEAMVRQAYKDSIILHISRDSTAIEAREKPVKAEAPKKEEVPKRGRGRPKKGEVVPKAEPRRLEVQQTQTLVEMLADLPTYCNVGTKKNAKGYKISWIGYKLHIDTADGDIPISCLLTSASLHDCQAAIPLSLITSSRVTNLYDLMDAAYDATEIAQHSRSLGHVPIIDSNPRNGKAEAQAEACAKRRANYKLAEDVRYNQRTSAERVNSNLKDNCGAAHIRVRGSEKVFCHLMFGIVVVTVEQMMRLVT